MEKKEYAKAVQRLLYQYNRYIHLKLKEDDSTLAESMTGYPGERDVVKCRSLEEQMKIWQEELKTGPERERKPLLEAGLGRESRSLLKNVPMELALEIDCPELYQAYLRSSLTDFSEIFAEKSMGICPSLIRNRGTRPSLHWKSVLSSIISREGIAVSDAGKSSSGTGENHPCFFIYTGIYAGSGAGTIRRNRSLV